MNTTLFVVLVMFVSLIVGFSLGFLFLKIKQRKEKKRHEIEAKEVFEGKRKNELVVDGKKYDATKFLIPSEDPMEDVKNLIDLKGGTNKIINDGKKEDKKSPGNKKEFYSTFFEEDSPSPRRKKRDSKTRIGRLRRFG